MARSSGVQPRTRKEGRDRTGVPLCIYGPGGCVEASTMPQGAYSGAGGAHTELATRIRVKGKKEKVRNRLGQALAKEKETRSDERISEGEILADRYVSTILCIWREGFRGTKAGLKWLIEYV